MDRAENAEIKSGTSFITRSPKNLLSDMAEDAEIVSNDDSDDDKTVKRSPLSKKPNKSTRYLTSLHSKKRQVSLNSFGYGWGS